jgi:cation transport regulator ChaC
MYDSVVVGTLEEKTKAARDAMAVDFDLHSLLLYVEDARSRALLPPPQPEKAYMWAEAMMAKGVSGEDIQFLANTLNPLPRARFSTVEILESGYLET